MLAALAALFVSGAAESGPVVIRSGLPWASGAVVPQQGFEPWRGRVLDVRTIYFARETWSQLSVSAGQVRTYASLPARIVVGLAMVPKSHKGLIDQCADGQFDPMIVSVRDRMWVNGARGLAEAGKPLILRLGWEANLTTGGHPWRATGDGTSWAGCFRRWVDLLDPAIDHDGDPLTPPRRAQRFLFAWNMANRGTLPHPIENMWPGPEYVDIVGSQFYARCPDITAENWAKRSDGRDKWGNPFGVVAWLRFARAKGKPYATPEWGVAGPRHVCADPGADNPFFVGKMHDFFAANAPDIAFEAYFNGHGGGDGSLGSHAIFRPDPAFPQPSDPTYLDYVQRFNPLAAVAYRQAWSAPHE